MLFTRRNLQVLVILQILGGWLLGVTFLLADDAAKKKESTAAQDAKTDAKSETKSDTKAKGPEPFPPPPNLVRLAKDFDIWLDQERKLVIVDGKVALREGQLEMFACPKQTKEHESIVAVNCKAQFVHAGLLALGAEPGRPVQFDPDYKPASGPIVEVWVLWKDDKGNHKVRAQEWIQNAKTGKILEHSFVFAGSGFHVDEVSGVKHYLAEGGDLICVSNFPSATLDLPIVSSQQNSELNFRAYTEKIPPVGTPIRLVLAPKLIDKKSPATEAASTESTTTKKTKESSPKDRPPK